MMSNIAKLPFIYTYIFVTQSLMFGMLKNIAVFQAIKIKTSGIFIYFILPHINNIHDLLNKSIQTYNTASHFAL